MLADIYIAQTVLRRDRMDLHRHATFSCAVARIMQRIGRLLGK